MKIIYELFLKTKFFVCFPIVILKGIKSSSFETEIEFKAIFEQQSIHSVYFDYVMSVCVCVCVLGGVDTWHKFLQISAKSYYYNGYSKSMIKTFVAQNYSRYDYLSN